MSFSYAIWLVPCDEDRRKLSVIINSLAKQTKTISFMPHVTLCSGDWSFSKESLRNKVKKLFIGLPIELTADGAGGTDNWSTYFFLKLKGAEQIFYKALEIVDDSHVSEVGEHLSLLYNTTNIDLNRDELVVCKKLPESITFDSLALVFPGTNGWEDIASWNIESC